jgi:hypothetical protein
LPARVLAGGRSLREIRFSRIGLFSRQDAKFEKLMLFLTNSLIMLAPFAALREICSFPISWVAQISNIFS